MLIRLTATAMLAAFVVTAVPTDSYAGHAKCQSLLTDMQRVLGDRNRDSAMDRLEDILDDMEEHCDVSTFLKAATKVGNFEKLLDKLKD